MKIDQLKILNSQVFNRNRIAIVGNGGVNAADNRELKGRYIIRFNNYATRQGVEHPRERYTCDCLFTTLDLHSVGSKPDHVVIGIPFPFKAEEIIEKVGKWYSNSHLHTVNPYWNLLMCRELGIPSDGFKHPFPSIGFTALWHLHRMGLLASHATDIYICGFNWYFDWRTKLCQGKEFGLTEYPSHWNHNYPNEVKWIVENLLGKININFSFDCRKILEFAKKQIHAQAH